MVLTIEQEIKEISRRLALLSTQVKQEKNEAPKQIEEFDEILLIAKQHALIEHPLREADDYTKDLYISFLLSLLYYAQGDIRLQQILIARIKEGSDCKTNFQELMKKGKLLTIEQYQEFREQLDQTDLSKTFIIDVLLLYGLQPAKELLTYIAKMANHLEIEEQEMKALSTISAAILAQDQAQLERNLDAIARSLQHGLCYIIDFVSELKSDTTYFSANSSIKMKSRNTYKHIYLYNSTVEFPVGCVLEDTVSIIIKQCKLCLAGDYVSRGMKSLLVNRCYDFRMVDCEIVAKDNKAINAIAFSRCKNVSMKNIKMKKVFIHLASKATRVISFMKIENLLLDNISIVNVGVGGSFFSTIIKVTDTKWSVLKNSTISIKGNDNLESVAGIENIINCNLK